MTRVYAHATEALDRVYLCTTCGKSFLFRADKEDHTEMLGHTRITVFTIEGKVLQSPDDSPR